MASVWASSSASLFSRELAMDRRLGIGERLELANGVPKYSIFIVSQLSSEGFCIDIIGA